MSVSNFRNQNIYPDDTAGSLASGSLIATTWSRLTSARSRFVLAALCLTILTYLLLSQDPWWLFRAFPKEATRTLKHGVIDKVYHLVAYFGTTCILMWYAAAGTRRTFYGVAAAVTVHAVGTELLQQFVPRRTTDIEDLFANLVGVAAGVAAGVLIRRTLRATSDASFDGPSSAKVAVMPESSPVVVATSGDCLQFERSQLSTEQISEVQPRQVNYRLLGIVVGVVGLMLASTYAVHGWQVRRVSGSLLQKARKAVVAGDTDVALSCFERYCSALPDDVNALAEFAILSDDVRASLDGGRGVFMLYERVLRKDPTRDDVRRRVVLVAIELARYSDALSHVKVLRQTHPKEGLFDFQAGFCHEQTGDYQAAAAAYEAAVEDSPQLIEPWERLAWLQHAELAQPAAAEQLTLSLVQVNSQDSDAWIARAKFRLRTEQFELAGHDIARAVNLAPNEFRVLLAAGEVGIARAMRAKSEGRIPFAERIAIETETLLDRGDQSKRHQRELDLKRIVLEAEFGSLNRAFVLAGRLLKDAHASNDDVIHELMVEIAIEHGDVKQATASLDRLSRSEVTDGQRLRVKALVAMSEQRWDDATKLLQTSREMLADSPQQLLKVDRTLADCLRELDRVDDQLVAYRRILKYAPQSVEARRGLASTLATVGRYAEALAEYRQLAHLPQVRLQLARHLIEYNRQLPEVARDWKEVFGLLDAAVADGDTSVELAVLQAEVFAAQLEFDKARRSIVRSLQEHPGNGQLLTLQVRVAELSGDVAGVSRLKGKALADAGQLEEAERQLRLTLLDTEDGGEAAISLMQFYLQHGKTDRAVEVFREHAPGMSRLDLSRTYEAFGDVKRAVDVLQQEVRDQHDNVVVLQRLSKLLIRDERHDLAEPLLERLLALHADMPAETIRSARRRLAVLLAKKQNYQAFRKATALMDQNAAETPTIMTNDLRAMSTVMRFSPKPSDRLVAIGLLEKVEDRQQMRGEDRWQLARLYSEVGLTRQAARQFDRAAGSGLATPKFEAEFVTHLIQSGELAQAREHLDRLPAAFPQADRVRLSAKYQFALGRPAEAVAVLDDFVAAGNFPINQVDRALLAAATCREMSVHENSAIEMAARDAALSQAVDRYLGSAVQADPGQVSHVVSWLVERGRDLEAFELLDSVWLHLAPETAANLSLAMLQSGSTRNRRERVEQHLVAKSKERPESLELKLCLADVKSLGRKFEAAEELYREILRTDGRHVPALNALAWGLAMRGRLLDEAMVFVERAIAQAGPVPQLLDTRGCVKLSQSRLRAATEDLVAATDAVGTATTFLHLAWVQAESGDLVQADKTLAHAVEIGLRAKRLHPLDQDLLTGLQTQIRGAQAPSGQPGIEL